MAKCLTGKEVAAQITSDLEQRIARLKERGIVPKLAVLRVGERPDDLSYERSVLRRAEAVGLAVDRVLLDADASQEEIERAVCAINEDKSVHGCLMFRPLPKGIDEQAVCDLLACEKDVDGISSSALAAVFMDKAEGFAPCTAAACMTLLDHYGVALSGARVVVVGRSLVIGKPVAMMLLARNATVTLCHSRTANLAKEMRAADVVICATGRARAYGAECFAPGQVVLDVGINFDDKGNLCGDVDFEAVEPIVDAITPVPGGIGSVTTLVTMRHTVEAAERTILAGA